MLRTSAVVALALLVAEIAGADTLTSHDVTAFRKDDASSILDMTRRRLVLVGGEGYYYGPTPFIETLDLADPHPAWQHPAATGPAPAVNLKNAPAVYDRARDRMIVFSYDTMYFLSLGTPMTWTQVTPTGSAPQLNGAQVILDPARDRIVGLSPNGASSVTWTLNLSGSPAWTALPFLGAVLPARTDGIAVYDQAADRMVVVGGQTPAGLVNDTWQLTFGGTPTWSQVATTGTPPPPSSDASFALDPATRSLYVAGGKNAAGTIAGGTSRLGLDDHSWSSLDNSSQGGWKAASAWDSAGARMVVAGGADGQTIRGGTFVFSGTWTQIPTNPRIVTTASFAGYDPVHHRWVGLIPGPALLSMQDSSWTAVSPYGSAPISGYGRFYDPATNLLGVFNNNVLCMTHPGVDSTWVITSPLGSPPYFDEPGSVYLDAPNHRVFVIGGWRYHASPITTWWALDYVTSDWSVIAPSTPLGSRLAAPFTDRRRNRMLVFGGLVRDYEGRYGQLGDCWSLDLSTLAFRQLKGTGTPPSARFSVAADYDSLRDRAIILGGAMYGGALSGRYYLQFSAANDSGAWTAGKPEGGGGFEFQYGAVDPSLDRFFVPHATSYLELAWDPPVLPNSISVACPPPAAWTAGSMVALHFGLTQGGMAPRNYGWTLNSQRAWPGFPLTGFQQLSDSNPFDLVVQVPVPDSVTVGIDSLTFSITDGTLSDSCRVAIGDAASPSPWALFQALVERNRVRLTWWTADRSGAMADVERRDASGAWEARGTSPVSGDGYVRFDDDAIEPGSRYAYRVGIAGTWSEETWVDVPAAALAFARNGFIAGGALAVSFTLPKAGPARLEAYDVAGRRVALREVSGAGEHTLELAPSGALRRGIYFLRLSQDGARVTARAVIIGGHE
jgi:hypothetical protein